MELALYLPIQGCFHSVQTGGADQDSRAVFFPDEILDQVVEDLFLPSDAGVLFAFLCTDVQISAEQVGLEQFF
jgi:hypothetical protein